MKKYLAIMASLVTSALFNMVYADIVIPESGLLVCTPDRPYTVSKENGSIGIEEGQKPCIVEAEENPFILYSIEKSDYCIDMDYIGSQCGKGGSGGKGEASGPFPDKLNWNDTNKLAEYNQGRYNTNRGQFFDKGIGECVGGSSLNFSGEISAMAGCDSDPRGSMGRGVRSPKPENTTPVKPPRIDGPDLAAYIAQFALKENQVPRFFNKRVTYNGDTISFDAYNFNVQFRTLIPNILITKDGMPSWFELSIRVNYGDEFGNASGNYIIVTVTYSDHNGVLRTEHASARIDGLDYEKSSLDWNKMKISYADTSISVFAKALSQNKDIESFIKNVIDDHHRHVKPHII